jgi:hypothetical protein
MSPGGRYNRLSDDARRRLSSDNPFVWEVTKTIDYPNARAPVVAPISIRYGVFFLWLVLIQEYGSSG